MNHRIEVPRHVDSALCECLADLQRKIWGMNDREVLPPWKLLVTPQTGGCLIVGYAANEPVGFAVLCRAYHEGTKESYLYLDMVGVLPDQQNAGLAFDLLRQAQVVAWQKGCLSLKWTYDPLEGANANLYIRKLGAVVRMYYQDYYGQLTGINAAVASDRFWAELPVDAQGKAISKPHQVITEANYADYASILAAGPNLLAIQIPDDFLTLKNNHPDRAQKIRLATRSVFQTLFKHHYLIRGFYREATHNFYVAEKESAPL